MSVVESIQKGGDWKGITENSYSNLKMIAQISDFSLPFLNQCGQDSKKNRLGGYCS